MINDNNNDDDSKDSDNNNTRIIIGDALRTKLELRQSPFAKTING